MDKTYNHLLSELNKIKIVDVHEHLDPHNNINEGEQADVLKEYLSSYIHMDLLSAGMSQSELDYIRNPAYDIEKRYATLEPYLEYTRNGSFFNSIKRAAHIVHGVDDINRKTIVELNNKYLEAAVDENYRIRIMREICNIETAINHFHNKDIKSVKTDIFAPVILPERLLLGSNKKTANITLDDYLENYRQDFLKKIADGAVAIKIIPSYWRSLHFDDPDKKTANELYRKYPENGTCDKFPLPLQDYIYRFIFKCADEAGIPVQIHTGLQGGMGHNLSDSNPSLLRNLFNKYKNAKFDLFHMGYPYERELIVLAKTFPNVYFDMNWAHIISPHAARAAFSEALDVVPYSKIFAFGGDYAFYDGVAGHLSIAKENVCRVLTEKILHREMTEDMAIRILYAVFRDNATKVFNLS